MGSHFNGILLYTHNNKLLNAFVVRPAAGEMHRRSSYTPIKASLIKRQCTKHRLISICVKLQPSTTVTKQPRLQCI
jgi:hypothetical protein